MRIGIIRYPGSNCDFDTKKYFDGFFIWHTEIIFPEYLDLLVIPGGFAFGDRLYDKATDKYTISPGTMAIKSPVTKIILEAAKRKIPILGICNGFQILTQLGLLPGKLVLNDCGKFVCKKTKCIMDFKDNDFNVTHESELYIANSFGKYDINSKEYQDLMKHNQVFLNYTSTVFSHGKETIAGVCNKEQNIFGMMPHPERNNMDFQIPLYRMIFRNNPTLYTQIMFQKNIEELLQSEHISYKSSRKYLKKLYTKAPWVVQGPGENAGIVDIGGGYCIAMRIESHNHPTFINPFEGAATGVGGILRDIFTMGARPIAILDFLRFGYDSNSNSLLEKTIEGISYYGNCVGVPNIGGDLYRDTTYTNNPIVNIACLGIVKKENIIYGNVTNNDNLLIYVGSKTGNEGINGAIMASKSFDNCDFESLELNVQKADPFLEKLLLEACLEITELKLVEGMQDLGAGGLLCATHEVVCRGRKNTNKSFGCIINIDKVPTKYDMEPYNVLISESQERMLIISSPQNKDKIFEIFKKWNLEYNVIGSVNTTGRYTVYNKDTLLYTEKMEDFKDVQQHWYKTPSFHNESTKIHNNSLWKIYDSTVGNRTIKGPNEPGSYAILDIPENNSQLFITWGENCTTCRDKMLKLDAKPLCIVNCLNFGHPVNSMGAFSDTIDELNEFCSDHEIPVVGGNVSLYNSTGTMSIKPTPVIVMLGISQ